MNANKNEKDYPIEFIRMLLVGCYVLMLGCIVYDTYDYCIKPFDRTEGLVTDITLDNKNQRVLTIDDTDTLTVFISRTEDEKNIACQNLKEGEKVQIEYRNDKAYKCKVID